MTDDALPAGTDDGLRKAYRTVLELEREVKELREDFSRLERKVRRDAERDRLTIPPMQA